MHAMDMLIATNFDLKYSLLYWLANNIKSKFLSTFIMEMYIPFSAGIALLKAKKLRSGFKVFNC